MVLEMVSHSILEHYGIVLLKYEFVKGGFLISGRRLINKGWLALEAGAGNGPSLGIKGSRTLTDRIFCTGGTTLNFRQNGIFPGLVGSMRTQKNWYYIKTNYF